MSKGVLDIKLFLPSKDFEASSQFYKDLGFIENFRTEQVAEFEIEGRRVLLQNFYEKPLAENLMVQLIVEDVDLWWQHIQDVGVIDRFEGVKAQPPVEQPWGQKILYLHDPSGVLWHIAEKQS